MTAKMLCSLFGPRIGVRELGHHRATRKITTSTTNPTENTTSIPTSIGTSRMRGHRRVLTPIAATSV